MHIMVRIKRTSLNLDLDLVAQAQGVLETHTTTDTVHRALEEVIRNEALRWLANWTPDLTLDELERLRRGWFPDEPWPS